MMGFFRAFAKDLYNIRFPIHHRWCRKCGRKTENFYLERELYNEVVGVLDCLCFRCLDRLRELKGDTSMLKVTREKP